jgi:hypothetical protein
MASNYPPGVSGREYEIAGPDTEREADGTCSHCGLTGPGLIQTYGYSEWFVCDACEETTDLPSRNDMICDDCGRADGTHDYTVEH